ncbi:MAG: hypothetical protein ACRD0O_05900 [Acidimicrobiia bacterium]
MSCRWPPACWVEAASRLAEARRLDPACPLLGRAERQIGVRIKEGSAHQ